MVSFAIIAQLRMKIIGLRAAFVYFQSKAYASLRLKVGTKEYLRNKIEAINGKDDL